jgi:hypothetical protein
MAFSITTLSITIKNAAHNMEDTRFVQCCHAERSVFIVILNVVVQGVDVLNVMSHLYELKIVS